VLIRVPSYPAGMNLSSLLAQMSEFGCSNGKQLEIDFSMIRFIQPEAVVSLSNMIRLLQNEGKKVTPIIDRVGTENGDNAIKYLEDCLFFQKHFGIISYENTIRRTTTNGLEFIDTSLFPEAYILETIKWLRYTLEFREKRFWELQVSLSEVFNNILDHSCAKVASCFAQHYPNKNRIYLAISDFGVGIPATIRSALPQKVSDAEAIRQATLPKVSSKTTPGNAGIGLSNIISIIEENDGILTIDSGSGRFVADRNRKIACASTTGNYPGTLITMMFRTDTMANEDIDDELNEMEGFEW
jgi:hypothetical protein